MKLKLQLKSIIVGVVIAYALLAALFFALFYSQGNREPLYHEQTLASGKKIKVTSFYLTWGIEHDERQTERDGFQMEYASSDSRLSEADVDNETKEAFELFRPMAELWGFQSAEVAAFPTTARKGKYLLYAFHRDPNGGWTVERTNRKVFANDPD